jgi:hypothetical protein
MTNESDSQKSTSNNDDLQAEQATACCSCQQHAAAPAPTEKVAESKDKDKDHKNWFTPERVLEIVKICATVWVALVGTIVTMQFNERQHELNRIEAIAKILPHLSEVKPSGSTATPGNGGAGGGNALTESSDMSRDGAIWAAFRIASNKLMLRDLAALFPEDIYRVVSSIAAADGLEHDDDALRALEVDSEKLASKYSSDPRYQSLSARLLDQSMRIREHLNGAKTSLSLVDLSAFDLYDTADQTAGLMESLNRLAAMHINAVQKEHSVSTDRSRARQLYIRCRQIGLASKSKDRNILAQLVIADNALAKIYEAEGRTADANDYAMEARELEASKENHADADKEVALLESKFKTIDKDGDGCLTTQEVDDSYKAGVLNAAEYQQLKAHFDAIANLHMDEPAKVGGIYAAGKPIYKDAKQAITSADMEALRQHH